MNNRRWRTTRLALALLIGGGFAIVWAFIIGLTSVQDRGSLTNDNSRETFTVLADGTPVIERGSKVPPYSTYFDLSGDRLDKEVIKTALPMALPYAPADHQAYGDDWQYRLTSFGEFERSKTQWFFMLMRDGYGGYFVGYDVGSNRRVGFLGANGFQSEGERIETPFRFNRRPDTIFDLLSETGMYGYYAVRSTPVVYLRVNEREIARVDLENRRVSNFFDATHVRSMAAMSRSKRAREGKIPTLLVRSDDEVIALDDTGATLARWKLPQSVGENNLSVVLPNENKATSDEPYNLDGDLVAYAEMESLDEFGDPLPEQTYRYWRFDKHGQVKFETEAKLVNAQFAGNDTLIETALFAPVPVAHVLGPLAEPLSGQTRDVSYQRAALHSARKNIPGIVITQVLGVVLAIVCHLRERRFATDRVSRVVWPIFVYLLGLPGWVGYRFSRAWPVRETCPTCKKLSPRDRVECASCQHEFPIQEPTGTEVFA